MSNLSFQEMMDLANQAADEGPDMTQSVKGGGSRLLPPGTAFARLIEVVELGHHAQEYQGKVKDPAMEVQLAFALWGEARDMQGNVLGTYHDADGSPYIMRPYSFGISQNEKARAFLMFKSLNWKGTAKSFGQLLGQTFLIKVVQEAKSKTDATIVSRLDLKTGILPPLDPVTMQPYNIPDVPLDKYKLFLWNRPTKAAWDALHIEGNYDDGKSKNFVQEKILGALNFMGSPLQQLLFSTGIPNLPSAAATAPVAPAAALPPGAGYSAPSDHVAQPTAPEVAPVAPLASPVVAAGVPSVATPALPASPVSPSVIPAGSATICPSSPAVAAVAAVAIPVMPVAAVMPQS